MKELVLERQIWCAAFGENYVKHYDRFRLTYPEKDFSLFCAEFADAAVRGFRGMMKCKEREGLIPFKERWIDG